jgi:hypothetical protein
VPESGYEVTAKSLTLLQPPAGPFELEVVTAIKPQDNSLLEGLYKSGGNYCTQVQQLGKAAHCGILPVWHTPCVAYSLCGILPVWHSKWQHWLFELICLPALLTPLSFCGRCDAGQRNATQLHVCHCA